MKLREALHMDYQKHVEYLPFTRAVLNLRLEEFNPDGCVCF